MHHALQTLLDRVRLRDPEQIEFHQAAAEVLHGLDDFLGSHPHFFDHGLLERLLEPERVILFRVSWVDDHGHVQVNRGYRVQMNSALGPYKGGLRFHPSVTLGTLKFLAFEQTFKNALTGLPLGGAKGGADFDPKGKSEGEVMRFCQAFASELFRHIGAETDVPAGDIGVGAREIGYLFGQHKRLSNQFSGVFTGKGPSYGGSLMRPEATGYGLAYFVERMLATRGQTLAGQRAALSGSGNVALYAAEKLLTLGVRVISLSDSEGTLSLPEGLSPDLLAALVEHKHQRRGRLAAFAANHGLDFLVGQRPWRLRCDIALPCATQNELDADDAEALLANGCFCVAEGANMPCSAQAAQRFQRAGALYAPGKASNAGGVAVSGLEMSQNATHLPWSAQEVDARLRRIMEEIHEACVRHGAQPDGAVDYARGANVAAFGKVAAAMLAQGVI
ncbi:NADP-specific glutamate dehydrogenase [Chromobacterium haemolyticum]|uniref:Glutamate dehydrogenase n=1 Tax=Chromobacterium haemolyticum TaxID=394935 RepID=A0ABS3GJ62_9NEIS|nr:NADP-specific glutamate dehydrogenase [Chromobacterium haemolyticum]MBK0415483.1 NADP-specific glutamate dehydrogenase [Chromobacterium haemolyticum]MBO0415097.1 NADP-specific glutamate dehydrogenase [Chromobacterium haemolyticum]MBO0498358.1 NADP-specific glutamate dehydrogenase [Chromobacterium haemolyticum]